MGGYGSGGHNRQNGQVENCCRLDSFSFYDFLNGDKYLCYKTDVSYPAAGKDIIYHVGTETARIRMNDIYMPLGLSRVPNIGGKTYRMYFLCPGCEKRARYLYEKLGYYLCRSCAGLNYASQQKNGDEEQLHKMQNIVEKKLEYSYWWHDNPDIMLPDLLIVPKPQYMRWEKYNQLMNELRELQKEYRRRQVKTLAKWGGWL